MNLFKPKMLFYYIKRLYLSNIKHWPEYFNISNGSYHLNVLCHKFTQKSYTNIVCVGVWEREF